MPADSVNRRAARTATMVAVPVALAVALISLWAYGGFGSAQPAPTATQQATSPVTMAAPALSDEVATMCRAVVAKLPESVRDLHRRPVSAGAEQNAAYGDPPITLACGGTAPSLPPTTQVYPLGDVCWSVEAGPTGTVWITVDRTVTHTVTVPGPPDGSGQSVVPFGRVIAVAVPRVPAPPSGCG